MHHRRLHESEGRRTYVVVLETGDEAVECLQRFAAEQRLSAAQITGIGAFSDAVLFYFDWELKDYRRIPVREQVEVAALVGDLARSPSGGPAIHLHVVLGKSDGAAMAGHLGEAHVRPTLEVIVVESPAHLRRAIDAATGLALIRPD